MTTSLSSVRPMTTAGFLSANSRPAKFADITTRREVPAEAAAGAAAVPAGNVSAVVISAESRLGSGAEGSRAVGVVEPGPPAVPAADPPPATGGPAADGNAGGAGTGPAAVTPVP